MRVRVIIDGVYQWGENTPATPNPPKGFSGGLVQGEHGQVEKNRSNKRNSIARLQARIDAGTEVRPDPRQVYATDEERLAARRRTFREAKARARQRRLEAA